MDHTETDRLFKTERFRYAVEIVNIMAPTCDPDLFYPDPISTAGLDAFYCLQRNGFDFLFTKEDYQNNDEIQTGLAKLNIDADAFWEALLILDYMSEDKFTRSYRMSPTEAESVRQFVEALDTQGAILISKKPNGRRVEIKSPAVKTSVLSFLRNNLDKKLYDDSARYVKLSSPYSGSITERISYEANILQEFFKRQYMKANNGNSEGYKRPLLLISRLLYFMRLATSEEYLVSSDRLKGDLRAYPNPGRDYAARLFFF